MATKKQSKIVIKDKTTGKTVKTIENPIWHNTETFTPKSPSQQKRVEEMKHSDGKSPVSVGPIVGFNSSTKSVLPDNSNIVRSNGVIKPIRDTQKSVPQTRQTKEEYDNEKKLKENSVGANRETANFIGSVAQEANKLQNKLQNEFFKEEITYGLIKGLSYNTLKRKIEALNDEYLKGINALKESGKYDKLHSKLTKKFQKFQKKTYKKAKRKYGKKLAQLLFYEICGTDIPKNKEILALEEEYDKNLAKLEEDHKNVSPPMVDWSDLNLSPNTSVLGGIKRQDPIYKPSAGVRGITSAEEIDISDECIDMSDRNEDTEIKNIIKGLKK